MSRAVATFPANKPRTYRGVLITYSSAVGYRVPWSAYVGGRFVYADTLDGIKAMIREEVTV